MSRASIVLSLVWCCLVRAEPVDVTAIKDKLTLFTDGKKHYVALVLTRDSHSPVFWSHDGRSFHQLPFVSSGSEAWADDLKILKGHFWEPRTAGAEAWLEWTQASQKLAVQCGTRETKLERVPVADASPVIAAAQFLTQRWNRQAYALARDAHGRYYYVDNVRQPEGAKSFRLFSGPKGNLRLQKMTNVVSDSQGDIFSTANGELRLILAKQDATWIVRDKPTKLVWVPVEDNQALIYTDLGVYAGEPLGTPCDDL
jgi:hypothetical protein